MQLPFCKAETMKSKITHVPSQILGPQHTTNESLQGSAGHDPRYTLLCQTLYVYFFTNPSVVAVFTCQKEPIFGGKFQKHLLQKSQMGIYPNCTQLSLIESRARSLVVAGFSLFQLSCSSKPACKLLSICFKRGLLAPMGVVMALTHLHIQQLQKNIIIIRVVMLAT